MMTRRRTLRMVLWIALIGIITVIAAVYYVFNKPHRNISKEDASYTVTARDLIAEFQADENAATAKYLEKVISVTGIIKSIRTLDNHNMVFSLDDQMAGVSCTVDSADVEKYRSKLELYTTDAIGGFKGRCTGMLMDIQLTDCVPE